MKRETELSLPPHHRCVSCLLIFELVSCYFSVETITVTAAGRRDETTTTIQATSITTTQVSTRSDHVYLRCISSVWLYIPVLLKSE
jgi:hypothetical protein